MSTYQEVGQELKKFEYTEGYYGPWKMFIYSENVDDDTLDWMVANIKPFNFANEDLNTYFARKNAVEGMVALLRPLSYRERLRAVRAAEGNPR